ncbi:MAG: hypothetical protein A2V69_00175 [Candidatus Portnoybacteria bacterium RBG_13_40_8]|uniref:DUF5667 domain-containing protein n=1 Tax=Candidatus Portnoybacteria bacterium RBG_13_40_8 TaxID=1801990 RepID=A0A1G2F611_9BACT|nr:MAG: hypothetical protein A2V69_00175 [Candidatus Portnoybacteria bacterium RBG_13_40_8]OGZ35890.1 MAG: hypothetical protein A2V60_01120 [Candidatus Portnoybacteria bacterium RIFCSPHIGHO2_01_FULL_39_19]
MGEKIIIFLILFSFIISVNSVWAKFPDDLPGPHLMPDDKFYFLKLTYEKVVLFLTFNLAKKAERYKTFAEKRLYEGQQMIIEGKQELADKQGELYKYYLNKAKETLEKAIQKAMEKKKEELAKELQLRAEEIKSKLSESFKLW